MSASRAPVAPASSHNLDDQDLWEGEKRREEQTKLASLNTPERRAYEAREARLWQSISQPTVHDRFSASFKPKPKFEPRKFKIGDRPVSPVVPPANARVRASPNARGLGKSMGISGLMRGPPQHLPYHQDSAEYQQNESYVAAEGSAAFKSRTTSTFHGAKTNVFPTFAFLPHTSNFGNIRAGVTYRMTCVLTNKGHTNSRFQIQQPDQAPGVHMRILYRPGMVAPGLERRLEIELCALQEGKIEGCLVVRTESNVFRLPIHARVGSSDATVGPSRLANTRGFGGIGKVRLFDLAPPPAMQVAIARQERKKQEAAALNNGGNTDRSQSSLPAHDELSGRRTGSASKSRSRASSRGKF